MQWRRKLPLLADPRLWSSSPAFYPSETLDSRSSFTLPRYKLGASCLLIQAQS